jgi:hypothetical protein
MKVVYHGRGLRLREIHGEHVRAEDRARACAELAAQMALSARRWPWADADAQFRRRALEYDEARVRAYRDLVRERGLARACRRGGPR